MKDIQTKEEIEKWYQKSDPWNYELTPDDQKRRSILLSEIPKLPYKSVLDIGCGEGFITKELPGEQIIGVDISHEAIAHAQRFASEKLKFQQGNIFDVHTDFKGKQFDLVIITGVLYQQYIGFANNLVCTLIDKILSPGGVLVSVHVDEWYNLRFPYLLISEFSYSYREFFHRLEVYTK